MAAPPVCSTPPVLDVRVNGTKDVPQVCGVVGIEDFSPSLLTTTVLRPPAHGVVEMSSFGSFAARYRPDRDYAGGDSFTYAVRSREGYSTVVTQQVQVAAGANSAPVCDASATQRVRLEELLRVGPYCTDADDDDVSIRLISGPLLGFSEGLSHSWLDYSPLRTGLETLTFGGSDGLGETAFGTAVEVIPNDANSAPTCSSAQLWANYQGFTLGRTADCVDPEGDAWQIEVVAAPTHGTAQTAEEATTFVYTPDAGFRGTDSFSIRAIDELGAVGPPAVVTASIAKATPGFCGVPREPVSLQAGQRWWTITSMACWGGTLVDPPDHGIASTISDLAYTPDPGYQGEDAFTVRTTAFGTTVEQRVSFVIGEDINDAPTCDDRIPPETRAASPVTIEVSCSDADNDPVTITAGQPGHGTVAPAGTPKRFTYTADSSFSGIDRFTAYASDGRGAVTETVVEVAVRPAGSNNPPKCWDLSFGATSGPVSVGGCSDVERDLLTYTVVDPPSHGTINVGGIFGPQYTPEPGFTGQDSFSIVANDGVSSSNVGHYSVTVGSPGTSTPACWDIATQVTPGARRIMDVDCGLPLSPTVTIVDSPERGTASLTPSGRLIYTAGSETGDDELTLSVTNPFGGPSGTVVVSIEIVAATAMVDSGSGPGSGSNQSGASGQQDGTPSVPPRTPAQQVASSSSSDLRAPRSGLTRLRDLKLGSAVVWRRSGALKLPPSRRSVEALLVGCHRRCTVKARPTLVIRGRSGQRSTLVLAPRTVSILAGGAAGVVVKLDARARKALARARGASLRLSLSVRDSAGTRAGTTSVSLAL